MYAKNSVGAEEYDSDMANATPAQAAALLRRVSDTQEFDRFIEDLAWQMLCLEDTRLVELAILVQRYLRNREGRGRISKGERARMLELYDQIASDSVGRQGRRGQVGVVVAKRQTPRVGAIDEDLSDRIRLASDPLTPAETLQFLFDDYRTRSFRNQGAIRIYEESILRRLAQNPSSTPSLLKQLVCFYPSDVANNAVISLLALEDLLFLKDLAHVLHNSLPFNSSLRLSFFHAEPYLQLNPIVVRLRGIEEWGISDKVELFQNGSLLVFHGSSIFYHPSEEAYKKTDGDGYSLQELINSGSLRVMPLGAPPKKKRKR